MSSAGTPEMESRVAKRSSVASRCFFHLVLEGDFMAFERSSPAGQGYWGSRLSMFLACPKSQ